MTKANDTSRKWVLVGLLSVGFASLGLINGVVGPSYVEQLAGVARAGAPGLDSAAARPAAGGGDREGRPAPSAGDAAHEQPTVGEPPTAAPSAAEPPPSAEPLAVAPGEPTSAPVAAAAEPKSAEPTASVPAAGLTGHGSAAGLSSPGSLPAAADVPSPRVDAKGAPTIYFDTRSSGLGAAERQALWAIGTRMQRDPSARVTLRGHADERGDSTFNNWLADRRAQVAAAFLVSMGIDRSRIVVTGLGASRPADNRGTEDALAHNRRVEVEWSK